MIEYQLKDANDNTYSLNGALVTRPLKDSTTMGGDSFGYDNKIIEKSFLPGASLIGEKRLASREYSMFFELTNQVSSDFTDAMNELLFWLNKTVFIVDVTNDKELEVTVDSMEIEYDNGALKHVSSNSFSFTALTPYWSNLTEESEAGTALADTIKEQSVTNNGYLEAYPIITLVATILTDDVQIYINSNNTGIQILDSSFGTAGNLTMIIDCEVGLVSINDVDRNVNIVGGTGFFSLPVGADTINILANEEIDYTIEWKERSFL